MEPPEVIEEFKHFFENNCLGDISNAASFFEVDFNKLSKWNLDLANELLDNPEETIKAAELVVKLFDSTKEKSISAWFVNLPNTQHRNAWEVRKDDIGKMIGLKGIINKSTSIIHICASAKFECPVCGNIINILQLDSTFKEPSKCGCGRKGKMTLLDKKIIDTIKLGLADDLMDKDNIDRSIAREKISILSGKDLTSHQIDKRIKPGRKVILNGYFKYHQKTNSTEFDSIFQVNSIEFLQVGWDTVFINNKVEKSIIELAK